MKNYARVGNGVVLEVISIPDTADIATRFTPEIVATLVACGPLVQPNWTWDGSVFHSPDIPVVNPPPTPAQLAQAIYSEGSATGTFLRGLVVLLGQRFNATPAQVVQAIINAAT